MATRSGSVDPGLVLWLIRSAGLAAHDVEEALERHSGLLGLAGSAYMREIVRRAAERDSEAQRALDVHAHRLRASIAAMTASLGGIDALTFTGGVGEGSPEIRRAAVDGLAFMGIEMDDAKNVRATGNNDVVLSAAASRCSVVVVQSREDNEIAAQTRAALAK